MRELFATAAAIVLAILAAPHVVNDRLKTIEIGAVGRSTAIEMADQTDIYQTPPRGGKKYASLRGSPLSCFLPSLPEAVQGTCGPLLLLP